MITGSGRRGPLRMNQQDQPYLQMVHRMHNNQAKPAIFPRDTPDQARHSTVVGAPSCGFSDFPQGPR